MAVRRGSTTMCVAPAARPASKYCMAGGMVAAGLEPTSRIALRLGEVGQRERQAAVDAEGAVAGGGRRATCRTGRCSRSWPCAARPGRTCRSAYAFSLVSPPPPKQPTPSRPYDAWARRRSRSVIRSSASSQSAGRKRAGPVARDACAPAGAAAAAGGRAASRRSSPCEHSPPRLVGKSSCGRRVAGRSAGGQHDAALQRAVRAVRQGGGGLHMTIVGIGCYSTRFLCYGRSSSSQAGRVRLASTVSNTGSLDPRCSLFRGRYERLSQMPRRAIGETAVTGNPSEMIPRSTRGTSPAHG